MPELGIWSTRVNFGRGVVGFGSGYGYGTIISEKNGFEEDRNQCNLYK
jgi:hypothetical protein